MGDRVRIGVLGNIADPEIRQVTAELVVVTDLADHFRIVHFQRDHIAAAADHFRPRHR